MAFVKEHLIPKLSNPDPNPPNAITADGFPHPPQCPHEAPMFPGKAPF